MNTLLYYPQSQERHSLFIPTTKLLDDRYNLVYNPIKKGKSFLTVLRNNYLLRKFYHVFIRNIISLSDLKSKESIPEDIDLVLASNQLPPERYPFILDLETVTALSNYNYDKLDREYISNRLEHKDCKSIICWNKASYLSLVSIIDCSMFRRKIKVIPFTIESKPIRKVREKGVINLLFISSTNNPQDFELKGGLITLEVFKHIKAKYPQAQLTVRASVPYKILKQYEDVKDIWYIQEQVNVKELEKIFLRTDILLEPLPGINLLLECMNFKIPVVTFDYWAIPEMVHHGKNGYLIDCQSIFGQPYRIEEYLQEHHINYFKLFSLKSSLTDSMLEDYLNKVECLIKNDSLRLQMADYSKSLISEGKMYCLDKRNERLLSIIEMALR